MTDAFIAIVVSGSQLTGYKVSPQIIEHDGTAHPQITVGASQGITPNPGDYVLVLTTRNNLDNLPVQRYFEASEACGRIVAVIKTLTQYVLTGKYKFLGDVSVTGKFSVTGDSEFTGDVSMTGNINITGGLSIDGTFTINGKDFYLHEHSGVKSGTDISGPVIP